jgi:hypothetical protein
MIAIRPYRTITVRTTIARKGLWADFMAAYFVFVDWILTLRYSIYFSDARFHVINLSIAGSGGPFNFEKWQNQSLNSEM